jgi:hypothetical protein
MMVRQDVAGIVHKETGPEGMNFDGSAISFRSDDRVPLPIDQRIAVGVSPANFSCAPVFLS